MFQMNATSIEMNAMIRVKSFNWKNIVAPKKVTDMLLRVEVMSKFHGWNITKYHAHNYILNLERNGKEKMNIYLSTMTVQTSINHPKKGKTQLNRKNITPAELEKLMKNVRQHTGKGYY